jgi:hypothetical protein
MRDGKYTILVGRPEGKRLFHRPIHRRENSTAIHFEEVLCKDLDWIHVA